MDSQITIALFVGGIAIVVIASLGDRARRRAPLAWHAHLPWHAIIFAGAAVALFGAVHLATLARYGAI